MGGGVVGLVVVLFVLVEVAVEASGACGPGWPLLTTYPCRRLPRCLTSSPSALRPALPLDRPH